MTEVGQVAHREISVDGSRIAYREAGPVDGPVLLLRHGYPCSSFEFRALMPSLADGWRTLAPDFPGCGYSSTPENFAYDFDGYASFLGAFCEQLGVGRCVLWLHDFGSQIGLRLAIARPELVAGLIIQNGDIHDDELGPGYDVLREYWNDPTPSRREALADAVTEAGYREEFLNDVASPVRPLISPDLWTLHWALTTPRRRQI